MTEITKLKEKTGKKCLCGNKAFISVKIFSKIINFCEGCWDKNKRKYAHGYIFYRRKVKVPVKIQKVMRGLDEKTTNTR